MSKYDTLWAYIQKDGRPSFKLTFMQIQEIAGIPIDRSLPLTGYWFRRPGRSAGAFSAGVMWQALPAGDNRANLENMFMLLFKKNVRLHKKSGVKKAGGGAGIIAVLAVLTAIAWGGIWFWKRKRSL